MIVSGHQPNYLPYLGFFDKIKKSDVFIVGDDAQFNYKDYHHRNRIRIKEGWKWLTIPVVKEFKPISEIKIKNDVEIKGVSWSEKHFLEIQKEYKKSPYFSCYESEIQRIYMIKYTKLIDLNINLIHFLLKCFDINTKIVFASDFKSDARSSIKIVEMINEIGGDTYLSGFGGKNYLDLSQFGDIKVEFQDYKHPIYKQCYDGFEANMAAIDALFNVGKLPETE